VPWRPIPGRDGVEIKSHARMAAEFDDKMQHGGGGQPQPYVVRAVKFLKEDIKKYGITQGCPGCTAANRNAAAVNHSDSCRIRIEKRMAEDRHPRYMRAMDRLAEAALRKESQEEATATTTAAAATTATTTATKRSADALPEGERTAKVRAPTEVRGEIRSREETGEASEKRLKRNDVGMLSTFDAEECGGGSLRIISPSTVSDPAQVKELLWTQGSTCVLGTELSSSKTKAFIINNQQLKE